MRNLVAHFVGLFLVGMGAAVLLRAPTRPGIMAGYALLLTGLLFILAAAASSLLALRRGWR